MAYSKEERERIIQYHLTSGNSLSRTSKEFGIGGSMTLAKWLKNFEESKNTDISFYKSYIPFFYFILMEILLFKQVDHIFH